MSNFDEILKDQLTISYEAVRSELERSLEDYLELQKAYKDASDFTVEEARDYLAEVEITIENIQQGIEKAKDPKLQDWFLTEGLRLIKSAITEEDYEIMKKGMEISYRLEDSTHDHFIELAKHLIHNQEKKLVH
ncbi:hypothetical protein vBKpMFBKp34_240 [Klebsiella phage vB_KpM_FBKp34]|nr:hypothetical protein vBKpMFBKp34_240 [Klebsiella phage vB_KpM_FBKp34]